MSVINMFKGKKSLFDVVGNADQAAAELSQSAVDDNLAAELAAAESEIAEDKTPLVAPTARHFGDEIKEREFFEVEKLPISGPYGNLPDKKGIFIGEKCINIVSPRYDIHQPSEIYQTFQNAVKSAGLEINRTIANPKNGGLLLSAKYGNCKIVGEDHDINLTFYTSHCGKFRTFLTLDLLRLLCENQVPALIKDNERHIFSEKHYKNSLKMEKLEQALDLIPQGVQAYNAQAEQLKDTKIKYSDFVEYFKKHYKLDSDSKQFDSKIAKLGEAYHHAPGQSAITTDSGYKAYNAITYLNTHGLRNSAMKEESIITRASNDSLTVLGELLQFAA